MTRLGVHLALAALPIAWALGAWPPSELDSATMHACWALLPLFVVAGTALNSTVLGWQCGRKTVGALLVAGVLFAVLHGGIWSACRFDVEGPLGHQTAVLPAWDTPAMRAYRDKVRDAFHLPAPPSRAHVVELEGLTGLASAAQQSPGAIWASLAAYAVSGLLGAVLLGAGLLKLLWIERIAPSTPSSDRPRCDAFISYNSRDASAVLQVVERLGAAGLRCWLDQREMPGGTLLVAALDRAVRESPVALVFEGPHGLGPWQRLEVSAWLGRVARQTGTVVPVVLPGAAPAVGLLDAVARVAVSEPPTEAEVASLVTAVRAAVREPRR